LGQPLLATFSRFEQKRHLLEQKRLLKALYVEDLSGNKPEKQ